MAKTKNKNECTRCSNCGTNNACKKNKSIKKPFTPKEKFEVMAIHNPAIIKFKELLELDIEF